MKAFWSEASKTTMNESFCPPGTFRDSFLRIPVEAANASDVAECTSDVLALTVWGWVVLALRFLMHALQIPLSVEQYRRRRARLPPEPKLGSPRAVAEDDQTRCQRWTTGCLRRHKLSLIPMFEIVYSVTLWFLLFGARRFGITTTPARGAPTSLALFTLCLYCFGAAVCVNFAHRIALGSKVLPMPHFRQPASTDSKLRGVLVLQFFLVLFASSLALQGVFWVVQYSQHGPGYSSLEARTRDLYYGALFCGMAFVFSYLAFMTQEVRLIVFLRSVIRQWNRGSDSANSASERAIAHLRAVERNMRIATVVSTVAWLVGSPGMVALAAVYGFVDNPWYLLMTIVTASSLMSFVQTVLYALKATRKAASKRRAVLHNSAIKKQRKQVAEYLDTRSCSERYCSSLLLWWSPPEDFVVSPRERQFGSFGAWFRPKAHPSMSFQVGSAYDRTDRPSVVVEGSFVDASAGGATLAEPSGTVSPPSSAVRGQLDVSAMSLEEEPSMATAEPGEDISGAGVLDSE